MKRDAIIAEFKAAAYKMGVPSTRFEVWTVGKLPTLHVTSVNQYAVSLSRIADEMVNRLGGERYAILRTPIGMLGRASESTFCFNITGK